MALGGGNAIKRRREVGILRYTEREPLVQRRPSMRVASGELPVQAFRFPPSHSPRLTLRARNVPKAVPVMSSASEPCSIEALLEQDRCPFVSGGLVEPDRQWAVGVGVKRMELAPCLRPHRSASVINSVATSRRRKGGSTRR